MTKEVLRKNLAEVGRYLKLNINDSNNGTELTQILSDIMAIQALSAECVVRAEALLTEYTAFIIESGSYKEYPARDRNVLIQRDSIEFTQLYNLATNYNKELHYRIEGLRTLISNAKELIRQNI